MRSGRIGSIYLNIKFVDVTFFWLIDIARWTTVSTVRKDDDATVKLYDILDPFPMLLYLFLILWNISPGVP